MKSLVGTHDILFVTLDTLRYDVAQAAWKSGRLPNLARYLGTGGWEKRHSPGSFTYSAHAAFFAGFLPTPVTPGPHPRPFAADFAGSTTITSDTYTFAESNLPEALGNAGYHTICIGGTGFFNKQTALAQVFPGLFGESHWEPSLGVTDRASEEHQIERALEALQSCDRKTRVFLFLNLSAIHQPNWFYGSGSGPDDDLASHEAALAAVDRALGPLLDVMKQRAPTWCLCCSDHGTAYGEDGHEGHRVGHEVVWTVPYAEFMIGPDSESLRP